MSIKTKKFVISGMVCTNCEKIIDKTLSKLSGVVSCKSDYQTSSLIIKYDSSMINTEDISNELNEIGYSLSNSLVNSKNTSMKNSKISELISIVGIVAIAFIIISLSKNSGSFDIDNALSSKVSFVALFVIGVFTSLHCVGMCGGIMLSQSITIDNKPAKHKLKPALLYNFGRLISYTLLGGIIGGIGQVFSLSLNSQAAISVFAGLFMVIMGFNMFGFKIFRKFSIKLPWSGCKTNNKIRRPFTVGLLNGLMPCGPLQTMQLYALASGSVLLGATSMFFFALGTIPLMLGFGVVANLLNKNNSNKLIKFSGVIVIVLGIIMANRGLTLLGISPSSIVNENTASTNSSSVTNNTSTENKAVLSDGIQTVSITANSRGYSPSTVYIQKGVPTKLIVNGEQINSCNNEIIIPSLNIRQKLLSGETIIDIPATDSNINYSCWMGMLRGRIVVVDDLNTVASTASSEEQYTEPEFTFYGLPLSRVATSRLVKVANIESSNQNIAISSDYGDLEPAVIVSKSNVNLELDFKVKDSSLDGTYTIYNSDYTDMIATFDIINGKANVELKPLDSGAYAISRDNMIYSVIEVVDEPNNVDLNSIRNNYF